ncbi:hypothetical protein BZG21_39155, partial [Escherichia coli]|nr:hypothetical protein [Escherichia coli]
MQNFGKTINVWVRRERRMYKQLVERNDKAVEKGLSRQVLDPDSRYYGGTIDPYTGVAWVNHTTG